MSKQSKTMVINSPEKDKTNPENFTKFILIPQYKGMQQTWPRHDIFIHINTYDNTEGPEYFKKVNEILKQECPEILAKYVLVRKDNIMKG